MDKAIQAAIAAFHEAARRVPAYRALLAEAGVDPEAVRSAEDFRRLPILDKASTFRRFPIEQLCLDGDTGDLAAVLTSSGHSGVFAFGLYGLEGLAATARGLDDLFDALFAVRSRRTLLINCLPMGVKVYTEACALGETSVRPDMACGLVEGFGHRFEQIVLIGETAFIKHVLELGCRRGIDWKALRVHVIVGEEPLAENARAYLSRLLGTPGDSRDSGLIASSMGIGEVGLNLFFEAPPVGPIHRLRRALHEDAVLRAAVLGPEATVVPCIFAYDPRRILVEFPEGQLVLTTLEPGRRLPLIRYAPGDHGESLRVSPSHHAHLETHGVPVDALESLPLLLIRGRGKCARVGPTPVYPEQVKEGLYAAADLAVRTTANFRLIAADGRAQVRVQLVPGEEPSEALDERFASAIAQFVRAPLRVRCERYESFGSGMALDYERKFDYLGQ